MSILVGILSLWLMGMMDVLDAVDNIFNWMNYRHLFSFPWFVRLRKLRGKQLMNRGVGVTFFFFFFFKQ